jgi:exopolysaccharide biosynthesis polyprenyl glycosylphosphotransferase
MRIAWLRWGARTEPTWRILVVGPADEAVPFLGILDRHRDWGIRIVGVLRPDDETLSPVADEPVLGTVSDLPRVLERENIAQVFMTGRAWDVATLRFVADTCEEMGVTFSMDANFLGLGVARAEVQEYEGWGVLTFSSTPPDVEALVIKRAIDVAGSLVALLLLAPVFLLVALLVKLEDGGPVLFVQERSGLYGRRFPMIKFRSMVVDAEARKAALDARNEMSGPVFKMAADPRVTRIGQLIRKASIDEIPQFWNVLRGEMSLVGPRPPIPGEVARYERWQMRRLSMKPGITCIWQVSGRNDVDFESWMRLDLEYIDNWSLFLDLKLMLRTLPVVFLGTGAR